MAPVHIRSVEDADRDAVTALLVAQLREHGIGTPETDVARTVAAFLRRPQRGALLVATRGGGPVGVAAVSFVWPIEHGRRAAWLEELYVLPAHRGAGIGGRLLTAACARVEAEGGVAVDLEVEAGHERAARLYERHGFTLLARARWVRRLAPPPAPVAPAPAETTGGCLCGAIRYRAAAPPLEVVHCHCSLCRRQSGAPFVTWATFPAAAFAVTAGQPAEVRATPRAVRTFCAACGSPLTFREPARPRSIDVTVGSADRPEALPPAHHIWTASALPWLRLDDDLARHPAENPAERDAE
jgi:ribosomal protein S18 acetylase RimI-like enzyme